MRWVMSSFTALINWFWWALSVLGLPVIDCLVGVSGLFFSFEYLVYGISNGFR